jgi:hypothetical protein
MPPDRLCRTGGEDAGNIKTILFHQQRFDTVRFVLLCPFPAGCPFGDSIDATSGSWIGRSGLINRSDMSQESIRRTVRNTRLFSSAETRSLNPNSSTSVS